MKDIVSHKEGHSKGIATNHSDPEHLWDGLGLPYTMNGFRTAVKAKMTASGTPATSSAPKTSGLQATALKDLSTADFIAKIGSLFTADQKKTGVLASVSLAQCILESGWGKSELALNANNMFGMKNLILPRRLFQTRLFMPILRILNFCFPMNSLKFLLKKILRNGKKQV